jgi:hypothetical protein
MENDNTLWGSIERKLRAAHIASQNLPVVCPTCGETLSPNDLGYDPQTNTRLWTTSCCGNKAYYEEKNNFGKDF